MPIENTYDGFATNPSINIANYIRIYQTTETSIQVDIDNLNMDEQPTQYQISYAKLKEDETLDGIATVVSNILNLPYTISNLVSGSKYSISVIATNSNGSSSSAGTKIRLNSTSFNSQIVSNQYSPVKIPTSKSYLTISNGNKTKKELMIAYRDFDSITIPTSIPGQITGKNGKQRVIDTYASPTYYAFGTTFFMPATKDNPSPAAGIAFFLANEVSKGYMITISSTVASAAFDRKVVSIEKIDGKARIKLKDSQVSPASTLDAIYAGTAYSLDVKVKLNNEKVTIITYINGFKITAEDETKYTTDKGMNIISPPTKKVGVFSRNGTVAFDYVYGYNISEDDFDNNRYIPNKYQGQFSNDVLNTSFGDLIYNSNFEDDDITKKDASIEEFGTVVREIQKVKTKFNRRPAYPLSWSVSDNKFASIIGSKISNFGGEAFVLNNSSTTIPLSDGETTSFYIYGNDISLSGQLEYSTDKADDIEAPEPVIFETSWLQNLEDVKRLADWIKTKTINQGKVLDLEVFGNPLLSVGDVVTIKYTYNGYQGSEKFILTNVKHSFKDGGLTTSIKCRTL
jgi:hypothetical protein